MSSSTVDPTLHASATAPAAGEPRSLRDAAARWWADVKGGELGALPILVGMVIIVVVFQSQNANFLTAGNFLNLVIQAAGIMTIAMGVVFVLLLGEIDLSVGFVSGVGGAIAALLTLPGGHWEFAGVPAIAVVLVVGLLIGTLNGLLFTKVGIPSFVVTLAGLLAWNGAVLVLIGDQGTVVIQSRTIIDLANGFISPAASWILVAVGIAGYAWSQLARRRTRTRKGLPVDPASLVALRIGALAVALIAAVWVANEDRGVPYVVLMLAALFVVGSWVLTRSRFGRHVMAIGGNIEAARRAGIPVDRVRIACFAIASMMATLGGVVLASRLTSVDTGAGGGTILLYSIAAAVIGGTSLFGGRGSIRAAVLGAIVIASIDNGLGLLGLASGTKFIITGLVLLAAVTVDSVARRNLAGSGRA
ncbi:sugar ABC transporter permease [Patulibacter sp. SYSU D01012]|uniref:sugar ABC transporter permease n=1 Tax=Patulibacter sp. SYSU D01012 TaxID=2817381 RepID=UPI001B311356|nr:sugar ABC transporter permease [Patulibacter sp. SYSU D01012]